MTSFWRRGLQWTPSGISFSSKILHLPLIKIGICLQDLSQWCTNSTGKRMFSSLNGVTSTERPLKQTKSNTYAWPKATNCSNLPHRSTGRTFTWALLRSYKGTRPQSTFLTWTIKNSHSWKTSSFWRWSWTRAIACTSLLTFTISKDLLENLMTKSRTKKAISNTWMLDPRMTRSYSSFNSLLTHHL